ncbi:MAG: response regulator [Litorilinea sp.]
MPNRSEFTEAVGDAYQHLFDLVYLRSHALTDLVIAAPQMRRKDKAWHLHQILIDVIDELDPGAQAPPMSPPWRRYRLMSMRYLEGIDAQVVADQLAISRRHFYRERDTAIEAVSDILWQRYMASRHTDASGGTSEGDTVQSDAVQGDARQDAALQETYVQDDLQGQSLPGPLIKPDTPPVADHFELLRSETAHLAQNHTGTRPASVLAGVVELLGDVAKQQGITLELLPTQTRLEVTVDPNILRHLLVGAVGYLLKRGRDACVQFQITAEPCAHAASVELGITLAPPLALSPGATQQQEFSTLEELATVGGIQLVSRVEDGSLHGFTLGLPVEHKQKILIVDDNADALELFQRFLVSHRYQVFTAQSAQVAQDLAIRLVPHVIIIDLMMPERDGWDLLQTLRNHPATQAIPLVVCSILRQQDLALALGAAAFLEKPFTEESLLHVLDTVAAQMQA